MLTTKGLVKHCERALAEKWGYVWGTFGFVLTEESLRYKLRQYPRMIQNKLPVIRAKWLGRRTADCVGLIKSYIWWDYELNDPVYNMNKDVNADQMLTLATKKGKIDHTRMLTDLNIPGLCLWKRGHIGVYIGNGKVIEAHSTNDGVILTPLIGSGSTAWTHWLECPYITTSQEESIDSIAALQRDLNKLGYRLDVDGDLGPITTTAIKHFQANNNLEVDGIAGPKTKKALKDLIAKLYSPKKEYEEILREVSDGNAEQWIKGIATIKELASASSDLGDLEIFQHLPLLIQKIYHNTQKNQWN